MATVTLLPTMASKSRRSSRPRSSARKWKSVEIPSVPVSDVISSASGPRGVELRRRRFACVKPCVPLPLAAQPSTLLPLAVVGDWLIAVSTERVACSSKVSFRQARGGAAHPYAATFRVAVRYLPPPPGLGDNVADGFEILDERRAV